MEQPSMAKKARLGAGSACELCRRRKQRCDGKRPACSNCLSRNTDASCQYRSEQQSMGSPGRPIAPPTSSHTVTPRTSINLTATAPASTGGQSLNDHAFYGDSSTFSFVSKLNAASALESCLPESNHPASLLGEKADAGVPGLSLPNKEEAQSDRCKLPSTELLHCLIDAYFERVHILYPCLHEPSFRAAWDAHQTDGCSVDVSAENPSWIAVLNLVFAHGTHFVYHSASEQDKSHLDADKFALTARRCATTALSSVTTLETVQALLLLSHYLQGTAELNDCWNVGGVLIRTAISLGLHIDPSGSNMTEIEKQVRKRVWAGCFIIDRTLSMKYGRPSAIPIAVMERAAMPATVDDQYIAISTTRPRQPQSRPSKMDFFVSTIDQAYIIDELLNDLYLDDSRLQMSRDQAGTPRVEVLSRLLGKAVRLEGRLQAWWEGVPRHLREVSESVDGIDFTRQRCVMSLRFLHVRLLIHRQAFVIWSRFSHIQSPLLQDIALSSSRLCVVLACQTIREIRDNFDQQRLGPVWYNLHYTFTAVGVLSRIGTARVDAGALVNPPADLPDLRLWALDFLDRWSKSSALAARYASLLRYSERRLADKTNSGPADFGALPEASTSAEDPFDAMTAFPDVDSTFLWTLDADCMDPEAWRFDSGLWDLDYQVSGQSL